MKTKKKEKKSRNMQNQSKNQTYETRIINDVSRPEKSALSQIQLSSTDILPASSLCTNSETYFVLFYFSQSFLITVRGF